MNSPVRNPTPIDAPPGSKDETTGLPWFRTWRGVYVFVLVTFILWVVLLLALTMSYS